MPIYEYACESGHRTEHYVASFGSPNPACDHCGGETKKLISNFNPVFTGALSAKYNDKKLENASLDGHWAWRVKSASKKHPVTGQPIPERVWIDSFQTQKEFCKAEGLVNPKDVGPMMMGSDGSVLSSRGLPGAW